MATISDGIPNVETTTLDEFSETHRTPDLMLVDVEGHAGEVLRGASGVFARRFIPMICKIHSEPKESAVLEFISDKARVTGKSSHFPYRAITS